MKINLDFYKRQQLIALSVLSCIIVGTSAMSEPLSRTELIMQNNEAMQEAAHANYSRALQILRRLERTAPEEDFIKQNLSQVLTDTASISYSQGQMDKAFNLLVEAVDVDDTNGPAWFLLGDIAYLRRGELNKARNYWKKALKFAPSDKRKLVVDRISRVDVDIRVERNFQAVETEHFLIRFETEVLREAIMERIPFFESQYSEFESRLGVSIPKLSIIVYPKQSFERVGSGQDWALGFYDGRIRIREDDFDTRWEKIIFIHELAHAFLHEGFSAALPIWIHEGFAQSQEPEHEISEQDQAIDVGLEEGTLWVPLEWLDKRFTHPADDADVARAYRQARYTIAFLIEYRGMETLIQFVSQVSQGKSVSDAFEEIYVDIRWSRFNKGFFPPKSV